MQMILQVHVSQLQSLVFQRPPGYWCDPRVERWGWTS